MSPPSPTSKAQLVDVPEHTGTSSQPEVDHGWKALHPGVSITLWAIETIETGREKEIKSIMGPVPAPKGVPLDDLDQIAIL